MNTPYTPTKEEKRNAKIVLGLFGAFIIKNINKQAIEHKKEGSEFDIGCKRFTGKGINELLIKK